MRPGASGGQATLELALLLPVVLLLIGSLVEVGMLVADQARLLHAAREGARAAAVDSDEKVIAAAAEAALSPLEVRVSPEPALRIQGEPVDVEVVFHPRGHIPLAGFLVRKVRLSARAVMRIERP